MGVRFEHRSPQRKRRPWFPGPPLSLGNAYAIPLVCRALAEAWHLDTGRPASRAHPAASLWHLIDEGPQQRCGPSGITAWEPALAGCAWGASSA